MTKTIKAEYLPGGAKRQEMLDKAAGVDGTSKLWDKVRKDINYFRQHNAEAYMVLLD